MPSCNDFSGRLHCGPGFDRLSCHDGSNARYQFKVKSVGLVAMADFVFAGRQIVYAANSNACIP